MDSHLAAPAALKYEALYIDLPLLQPQNPRFLLACSAGIPGKWVSVSSTTQDLGKSINFYSFHSCWAVPNVTGTFNPTAVTEPAGNRYRRAGPGGRAASRGLNTSGCPTLFRKPSGATSKTRPPVTAMPSTATVTSKMRRYSRLATRRYTLTPLWLAAMSAQEGDDLTATPCYPLPLRLCSRPLKKSLGTMEAYPTESASRRPSARGMSPDCPIRRTVRLSQQAPRCARKCANALTRGRPGATGALGVARRGSGAWPPPWRRRASWPRRPRLRPRRRRP